MRGLRLYQNGQIARRLLGILKYAEWQDMRYKETRHLTNILVDRTAWIKAYVKLRDLTEVQKEALIKSILTLST